MLLKDMGLQRHVISAEAIRYHEAGRFLEVRVEQNSAPAGDMRYYFFKLIFNVDIIQRHTVAIIDKQTI